MPAPSQLAIATSALSRLVKEESSYHKELEQQSARIAKLEAGEGADDENAEYILRQHVRFYACNTMPRRTANVISRNKLLSRPRLYSLRSDKRFRMR